MSKIKVNLTTEKTGINEKDSTNIYPYNYSKDYIKINLAGKKQILIHDFHMINPSRVEIFWNQPETKSIYNGHQAIDIPLSSSEMIFVLDEFVIDRNNNIESCKERIAEFEFELI